MAYANGRLPSSALGTIPGTSRKVLSALVPQTTALRAAFQSRFNKPLVVTDAYRDYDAQVRVKKAKGWLAATPGQSNHGWGQAIDFGSGVERFGTPEYNWMKANAPRFGWTHPAWAEPRGSKPEAWHWEAVVVPVSNYVTTPGQVPGAPNVQAPTPITPEDFMALSESQQLEMLKNVNEGRARIEQIYNAVTQSVVPNTNRIPKIQSQVDIAVAQGTNITNGVVSLLGRDPGTLKASDIADAIPDALAKQVADELVKRLKD